MTKVQDNPTSAASTEAIEQLIKAVSDAAMWLEQADESVIDVSNALADADDAGVCVQDLPVEFDDLIRRGATLEAYACEFLTAAAELEEHLTQ
jgi:hypothetical protein